MSRLTAMNPPRDDDPLHAARARVERLQAGLQRSRGEPVRRIETHLSWVLLGGAEAWKLKKPLRLPFVDFTTFAARRHACDEELRLNRRLAPAIYLDVLEVRGEGDEAAFGGGGALLDVAVHMRRFADGALWSERLAARRLAGRDVEQLARRLADFHRAAAVAPAASGFGSAAVNAATTARLVAGLDAWCAGPGATNAAAPAWPALRAWLHDQSLALAPTFEARRRAGAVREGHGDLHLDNLIELEDGPTAFDAVEFDPALRWIDVVDDIAFVAMDLLAHSARALAFRFVDAWLAASGDGDGLSVLRFYLVRRALVRAQVAAIAAAQGFDGRAGRPAADYLALAVELARAADARLAITHGLPGSGKSVAALALLEAAGAIRVRSDVERKRLFGLEAEAASQGRVRGGIYTAAATARTYARLREVAAIALDAGWPTIVDAAFLRHGERADFAALAAATRVPFSIVDCRAPRPLLRARIAQRSARGDDPSEADLAVLERLAGVAEPLDAAEDALALVVDAAEPLSGEALARRWRAAAPAGTPVAPGR